MDYIALLAPFLLLVLACMFIAYLTLRKFKIAIYIFVGCLILNWLFSIIPVVGAFRTPTDSQGLKVLSFNCNLHYKEKGYLVKLSQVQQLLINADADVVFLTENYYHNYDTLWRSLKNIYPYCICDSSTSGNCIYSKYTIRRERGSIDTPNCITPAIISFRNTDIKIIGCHLTSNNYDDYGEYHPLGNIGGVQNALSYLKNIGNASEKRITQTKHVSNMVQTYMPSIVLGDMNDLCGSPSMQVLSDSGLKDGWWERGFGYGATIHHLFPFRIDHIMYKNNIMLLNIERIDCSSISDHDAMVALFK